RWPHRAVRGSCDGPYQSARAPNRARSPASLTHSFMRLARSRRSSLPEQAGRNSTTDAPAIQADQREGDRVLEWPTEDDDRGHPRPLSSHNAPRLSEKLFAEQPFDHLGHELGHCLPEQIVIHCHVARVGNDIPHCSDRDDLLVGQQLCPRREFGPLRQRSKPDHHHAGDIVECRTVRELSSGAGGNRPGTLTNSTKFALYVLLVKYRRRSPPPSRSPEIRIVVELGNHQTRIASLN